MYYFSIMLFFSYRSAFASSNYWFLLRMDANSASSWLILFRRMEIWSSSCTVLCLNSWHSSSLSFRFILISWRLPESFPSKIRLFYRWPSLLLCLTTQSYCSLGESAPELASYDARLLSIVSKYYKYMFCEPYCSIFLFINSASGNGVGQKLLTQ